MGKSEGFDPGMLTALQSASQYNKKNLRTCADGAAEGTRYLRVTDAVPVARGHFLDPQTPLYCLDLHFHRPTKIPVTKLEALQRGPANGAKGTKVGVARPPKPVDETACQAISHTLESRH
jgi:hypothetical protein